MEKEITSLTLLNNLIEKLEANTGGEKTTEPSQKVQEQVKIITQVKQPEIKEEVKEVKEEKIQEKKVQKKVKQEKVKAEKKKEPEIKKQQVAEEKDEVGPSLFAQIDLRVSEIVECWKHPESENLYCEKILVCGEVREIASGLQKFVPLDQMKGKVIVMANLKPRPLAGFASNGMVVCASNHEHTQVELIIPEGELGERIHLEGHQNLFKEGPILPVLNPKKKIVERCLEHFATDQEGNVIWKGIRVRTKAGYLKATIKNGSVS